jgi:aspartyl-tRNA(Asn)/glutamyl-tRNA(Gln) amidotransferase subunit C
MTSVRSKHDFRRLSRFPVLVYALRLSMVTREQVLHVARLAKLALGPEEEERLTAQLARILDWVEQLREIEDGADELTHVLPVEKPLRADDPHPGLPRAEVLALAPSADGETMRVPAVLEGKGGR